jgi:peptidoglycan/LPS O-acetylase OafA/YrhL
LQYRKEIDGLRAVAVLPVIFFHAGFSAFSGGFVGVDIFFVISGYLITSILIGELERGDFSISRFYERRARRILPALFVVLLACLPFAYMWMLPAQLKDFSQSLIAVVFFASNFLFWREDDYFGAAAELKPLLHTWSLAVEEQYYVLFPLVLLLGWRFGRQRLFWSITAFSVLSLLLSEWGWRNMPSANFYLAPTRAWELLAGSICAFLTVGKEQRSSNLLSAVGLLLIVFSIFAYTAETPFPSLYALVPVVGTALVILFAARGTWTATLLSTRALVGIGMISYSAYLWHQPLFAFARLRSLTEPSFGLMIVLCASALLLAWGTWRYVEQPFRKRPNPLLPTRRSVFVTSAVVGAAFVVIGLTGHFGRGFEWRLNDTELQLYRTALPSPKRGECHFGRDSAFAADESCEYFHKNADVAVYGNSHGVELAYGIAEQLRDSGRSVIHFTISGCAAGFERETEAYCEDFFTSRRDYLLASETIKAVVLTFRAENGGDSAARSIIGLANFLDESGKKVVLVLQAPILHSDISAYIGNAFVTDRTNIAALSRRDWKDVNSSMYEALAGLNPGVRIFDMADAFCDAEDCYAVRGNAALYFDDNHMSIFGARRAAPALVELLD